MNKYTTLVWLIFLLVIPYAISQDHAASLD
jgi:hypothetical protein